MSQLGRGEMLVLVGNGIMHKTAPYKKKKKNDYPAPNVNSAKVEKPSSLQRRAFHETICKKSDL